MCINSRSVRSRADQTSASSTWTVVREVEGNGEDDRGGGTSQRETAKSKWKHLTLRLKADPGEYGSEPCVTYHKPLLPPADN